MSEELATIEIVCEDEACNRKHRPDGTHYSSDPSVRMAQLKEEGRVGGEYGKLGGRPRAPRASEAVAEHARKRINDITASIDEMLQSENMKIREAAIKLLLDTEHQEAKQQLEEDKFDHMTQGEMADELLKLLGNPSMSKALDIEIVDVEVVE